MKYAGMLRDWGGEEEDICAEGGEERKGVESAGR